VNKVLIILSGIIVSIFLLFFIGGKENNTTDKLKELRIDKLMPPNERVYLYMKQYSKQYKVPLPYILRCAKLESNYKGLEHVSYAPFEDWLVSTANAYSVLQVRVIAAREVWPQYNFKIKHLDSTAPAWSVKGIRYAYIPFKYRQKYNIPDNTKLEYKTDAELAHMLRYNLKFNIETGIRYMKFLHDTYGNYLTVYSVYNQGWRGARVINAYAKYITKVKVNEEET